MKSIFSKLVLSHLLALVIAFGLLALLLRQVLLPYYVQRVMGDQLLARGQALAAKIAPALAQEDFATLAEQLEMVKASLGAEVCLVNTDREVIANAVPEGSKEPPLSACCGELALHRPSLTVRAAALTACGQDMLVASIPVNRPHAAAAAAPAAPGGVVLAAAPAPDAPAANPNALGVLLLRLPIADIHATASRMGRLILLCAVVGLILALAAAFVISDRISGPLRKMRKLAVAVAGGDFNARLQAGGRDEIGQLADSFNTMTARLQQSLTRLQDESAKLRGVLGSMAEGVIAVDTDESILLANPQIFGVLNIPQRELMETKLASSELPDSLLSALRTCLKERRMVTEEILTSHPAESGEGEKEEAGVAAIHVVPMHLGQEAWGAVAVIRDISEARRLEGMRRRFFQDISHELRTPLTNITGYATGLQDGTFEGEQDRNHALSVILKESERVKRFVDDLLELSRLQSGKPVLQKDWVDIEPVARAAAESLEYLADQNSVGVHLDMPRDLPQVFADPDRLQQVFVNLIANAIHFNRPEGEVIVSAQAEAAELRVTIRDTGMGIPADELPFVWERFHRASTARAAEAHKARGGELRTDGSGIGLAIVRGIIQAHGGRVWAVSAEGEGATFGFALPLE